MELLDAVDSLLALLLLRLLLDGNENENDEDDATELVVLSLESDELLDEVSDALVEDDGTRLELETVESTEVDEDGCDVEDPVDDVECVPVEACPLLLLALSWPASCVAPRPSRAASSAPTRTS